MVGSHVDRRAAEPYHRIDLFRQNDLRLDRELSGSRWILLEPKSVDNSSHPDSNGAEAHRDKP